jgi:hypothetical protein
VTTIRPGSIAGLSSLGPDARADLRNAPHVPSAIIRLETLAMRPIQAAVIATLLLATTAHADAREINRYLDLINRAHDSVITLEIAPTGSDAFEEKPLGEPLHGGGGSTTNEIAGEGCVYNMRLRFANGRTLIYKEVDMCSGRRLVIRPLPRKASSAVGLVP